MNTLQNYINKHFSTLQIVGMSSLLSIALLTIRIKFTHDFDYLFLIWNLILAVIPYVISSSLIAEHTTTKLKISIAFLVWLAFLPNAPYIVTDLWHLKFADRQLIWLDMLIVFSFASTGLLLFYLTISDMKNLLKPIIKSSVLNLGFVIIFFLNGFGIYLGRFLRYNSWEILSNPKTLFIDVLDIIVHPQTHNKAWLFSLCFGCFLWCGNWVFKAFKTLR